MSRFGLLLALLSLFFVASTAQLSLNESSPQLGAVPGRQWQQITARAAWSPRAGGVVEWYKGSVRLTATRVQAGPQMLMYGVGVWSNPEQPEDRADVWASTNGRTWVPVYVEGDGFSPLLSAITVQDSQGRQFRIQGAEAQPPNNGVWGDVYMSTNGGSKWTLQGNGLPSDEGRFLGQAVVDSKDTIYVTMGQYAGGPLQDIWMSTNQGRTWSMVRTQGTLPPARAVHGSVVTKFRDGTDAMYIMYGWERGSQQTGIGNVYRNDVWVSTTGGRMWTQLLAHAPWAARGDCQVEVTDAGVIIIAGGVSSASGDDKRELNDVWASLDGGYSWGQCVENAEFTDRQFPYTLIDGEGYLWMMGGREEQNGGRQVNDVWRSAFSFADVNEVAARCNLFVPSCGVGLKCLPNEGDATFMQGGWGVSCAACPYSASAVGASSGAGAANNTMTILFVVFMLLFLLVTALLIFTYYKMRQSGVTSPIPLPAGAQRWWNGNSQQGVLGEGLTKGSTDSADTYNQLSIRDQM